MDVYIHMFTHSSIVIFPDTLLGIRNLKMNKARCLPWRILCFSGELDEKVNTLQYITAIYDTMVYYIIESYMNCLDVSKGFKSVIWNFCLKMHESLPETRKLFR